MSRDGINYSISCPTCKEQRKDKKKLVVRLDDGRYHCWVCGSKGSSIIRLISKFRPDLVENVHIKLRKDAEDKDEEEVKVSLPNNIVSLSANNQRDPDLKSTLNYLRNRGLNNRDIIRWRIQSCTTGTFRRRVIIPSFDNMGNLNYYVARTIDPHIKMKYQNAKVSKETIVFNEVDIDWSQEVTLVEGVFDAIKCPENTIPILGSSLSMRSRLFKLLSKHQTPCIVSLDPDLKHKAFRIADTLVSAGCEVRIGFAPVNKDLGDLTKIEAFNVLKSAERYSDVMRITHKIRKIKSGSLL